MNRSILSLAALSAIAYTSAASAFILNDTRRAGDNYSLGLLSIDDGTDTTNAGGEAIKSDDGTVVAKGETISDGTEGNAQHVAAAENAAAPGTETLSTNKDGSELGGQTKAIDDPAAGQVQQA